MRSNSLLVGLRSYSGNGRRGGHLGVVGPPLILENLGSTRKLGGLCEATRSGQGMESWAVSAGQAPSVARLRS